MRRFLSTLLILTMTVTAFAVPARRGLWKNITLSDGRQVRACLQGDEMMRYYSTENGDCYMVDAAGFYKKTDIATLKVMTGERRRAFDRFVRAKASNATGVGGTGKVYQGNKKGLIILVQFPDKKFRDDHDIQFYKRLANEPGFSTPDGFNGSVKDYFKDQSLGMLEVDFDVIGPVTTPNEAAYYGRNVGIGGDAAVGIMVAEACQAIDAEVNFADYDWDGDGEVDQIFVLYAGMGEASGGSADTIWPHMWQLSSSEYGKQLILDDVILDTYACSCELTLDNENDFTEIVDGIGTICHEFSHCLGYPDMYDTSQFGTKNFGMDVWDLMDYGSYNDGGFTPSGYTAYERWVAGWITPVELTDDTSISDLKPVSEGGDAYIVFNSANNDEFFIFENRKRVGWDAKQPASGLMALHVDYDLEKWNANSVNNDEKRQRCTILHADGTAGSTEDDLAGDLYPWGGADFINSMSDMKPLWYSLDADGHRSLGKSLTDIVLNDDLSVSFNFSNSSDERNDYLLFETFDDNSSQGGNDGIWTGSGSSKLLYDLSGWEGVKQFAGFHCARFGTKSTPGSLTSPEFDAEKDAVLTCLVGPWAGEQSTMTVSFISSETGEETEIDTFSIIETEWQSCEMKLPVDGKGRLKFASSMRQFLDEVRVAKPSTSSVGNIIADESRDADCRVFSIDGRYLGDDINALGRGLYIVGGKKVCK